jgi:hypothetical protein
MEQILKFTLSFGRFNGKVPYGNLSTRLYKKNRPYWNVGESMKNGKYSQNIMLICIRTIRERVKEFLPVTSLLKVTITHNFKRHIKYLINRTYGGN